MVKDEVMEIGLTANRGDAASHVGVANDLAALLKLPFSRIAHDNCEDSEPLEKQGHRDFSKH